MNPPQTKVFSSHHNPSDHAPEAVIATDRGPMLLRFDDGRLVFWIDGAYPVVVDASELVASGPVRAALAYGGPMEVAA